MKGKILNKARLAGAVMLATAGVAAGTAQADSLLAPLVIYDTTGANAGTSTYFAMKVRGSGIPDQFTSAGATGYTDTLHYYYIQKTTGMGAGANTGITGIQDLHTYAATGGCHVQNNSGKVSSWDVIFQDILGASTDFSQANGWVPAAGDFYGMVVMDDQSNLPENNGDGTLKARKVDEGEFSGFAYIVNTAQGLMMDYKLINNHLSKQSGDFTPGYISKQSIDWMWLPATNTRLGGFPVGPGFTERTAWYTAVTGLGMSRAAENTPGSRWDEVVTFTQQPIAGEQDIQKDITAKSSVSGSGAYNNDEDVVSGDKDLTIKCLGLYDRSDFLTSLQIPATANGGWKPVNVVATSNSGVETVKGRGALTYRFDDVNGFFTPAGSPDVGITMQVETGGNRNAGKFGSHPNRGY